MALPAAGLLAVGLGANVAIFAVAYAVLLRPLPVADQQSLVIMWERSDKAGVPVWEVSHSDFRHWQASNRSFTDLAALGSINWSVRLMQSDGPVTAPFAAVSGGFFHLLGARATLGRTLTTNDDQRASPPVAVLSHAFWHARFGADPAVIGRTATMDDGAGPRPFTIVGVMSRDFDYPRGAAMWLPLVNTLHRLSADAGYDMIEERHLGILYVLGRLKPRVDTGMARQEMDHIVEQLTGTGTPGSGRAIVVTRLTDHIFGQTRPALLLLLGAAGIVWLLTCVNVVGLLVARLSSRQREWGIHLALGARRGHLLRRTVTEAAGLVLVGSSGALLLAFWGVPLLTALVPEEVPRVDEVNLTAPALLLFSVAAGLMTTVICGIVPIMVLWRRSLPTTLGLIAQHATRQTRLLRSSIIAVQIALAVVLLVAATLTARSFGVVQNSELGFVPGRLMTFDALAPRGKYDARLTNRRFYQPLLERLRQLPEVTGVAGVYLRPFEHGAIGSGVLVILEGQSPKDRDAWRTHPSLNAQSVTPEYFSLMNIPVLQGRTFNDRDVHDAPGVAIVSASTAARLWPGQNPIGKRLMANYDRPAGGWQTVVGVVADVRYRGVTQPTFDFYKPYLQSEDTVKHLIVASGAAPSVLWPRLRSEIRAFEPAAVVDKMRPMQDVVERQFVPWRFSAVLFALFAGLAVVIAVAGLYGVLAYQTADRTREIGIRMALGATRTRIVALFAHWTGRVVMMGLLAGALAAFFMARSMSALLFGVAPYDTRAYAAVCVVILIATCTGAYLPIRRATTIDPAVALRRE